MNELGDVKINGKYYRTVLTSYSGRDVVDFSPKATVPGGGVVYSDLALYQPQMMSDWRHGFGFQWWTDAMGYMNTEGQVDTRHGGIAMLFTSAVASDDNASTKVGFTLYGTYLVSWGAFGLRYFNGSEWVDSDPVVGTKVNYAWTNGKYLFAAVDGGKIHYTSNMSTWTATGVNEYSVDYLWIVSHDGFIYAVKEATTGLLGNQVFYTDKVDMADIAGAASDDPNVIYVGPEGRQVIGALTYLADLLFIRYDGIYRLDKDLRVSRKVLDFSDQISATNFRSWAIHNNLVVFSVRDRVYQWNGIRVSDITPPRLNDTFPYVTYGLYDNFTVVGRFLFMTARTNETTFDEDLLCWDGVGWHKLMTLVSDGVSSVTAMYYDTSRDRLWFHVYTAHETTPVNATSYIQFQTMSELPYAAFPTTGTHSLISSRIDGGYRRIMKSTPSLLIETQNCDDAGTHLLVYYSLDGGTWTAWGGTDKTTNKITENGVIELDDPLGTGISTIEYNHIQIRVDFVTDNAAQSPILEGLVLRVLLRPDTYYGYSFMITTAPEYDEGMRDGRSPREIIADLHDARASYAPIEFIDIFGESHQVYVTAVQEQAIDEAVDASGPRNIEHLIRVNLVEVA